MKRETEMQALENNENHIPTQFGKLIFQVFRDVQYNSRERSIVSGKTNFGSHVNLTKSFRLNTRRPFFGGDGSMHPSAEPKCYRAI